MLNYLSIGPTCINCPVLAYTAGIRPTISLIPDKELNYRTIWLNTGHLATPGLVKAKVFKKNAFRFFRFLRV